MKRALVTGATGFIGQRLVQSLRRRGVGVTGAVRAAAARTGDVEIVAVGDLSGATDWSRALSRVDSVFHLAARVHLPEAHSAKELNGYERVNVDATKALAQAAVKAGVERFVFLSSVKVMGEVSPQRPFQEEDSPQPRDAYASSKLAAEHELKRFSRDLEVTIIRPPLVYGPGVKANFLRLLRFAATSFPLPLAAANAPRSLVFVDNLVDALIASASVDHPSPATYFVSDGQDVSVAELIRMLREELGVPARLWSLPGPVIETAARVVGRADAARRLLTPLQIDTHRIRSELGWSPAVSLRDGLRETVRAFVDARSLSKV